MNQIKDKGVELQNLIAQVRNHTDGQVDAARAVPDQDEITRISEAQPARWISISQTHFQEGLMCLTRAVAQPTFF